ncbi:unnamed protein product, partial [Staurois parvus]
MTAGTGSDIGSSDWTAGIGSPGIKSFGSTASTASSGKAVGSESTGMTAGHRGQTLNRLAGQRASGHQASGHLARQRAPRHLARQWSPSQQARQWAPGHQVPDCLARQRASGHQASGHLACQRAPRHLARQWAPSHQVRQRALSQLARRGTGSGIRIIMDQQRASSQL